MPYQLYGVFLYSATVFLFYRESVPQQTKIPKVETHFGLDRAGDIKHFNADIRKAKELLDYDPELSFDRGIKVAIEWYKENVWQGRITD